MKLDSQPMLGLVASVLVVSAALWISVSLSPEAMLTWVSLIMVAMVPMQMVIGLAWGSHHPASIAAMPQLTRGLAFSLLMATVGALVAYISYVTVGGSIQPPTPFVNMFLIFAVPMTLTLIIPFQRWPFTALLGDKPVAIGFALLVTAYGLAWLLYHLLFDFSFSQQAPFYQATLDPHGMFTAWLPLTASLGGVVAILCLVLLDFWPLPLLAQASPAYGRQPLFGIAASVLIALIVAALWYVFITSQGMDVVAFMVRVCVSMIFGVFVILVMFEGAPFVRLSQPWRGLVLIFAAALLAVTLHALYRAIAISRFGLPGGAPDYALELWLATSMLAITFPLMVAFASFFNFWPLRRFDQ
ncbi:hypothetical protein [Rugosibacter aromaticivorans]|uniref:hypothetical protein n=1 Tax=Rugosibacter aromaticivorans TaxID=1565605 RepID=UPI0012149BDF|nr:hypothetical protein [Rugosibacter aromaticivorans]TBR16009.1 MAG: hypothetical protein EPO43_02035 [Rugosibacter sp.]